MSRRAVVIVFCAICAVLSFAAAAVDYSYDEYSYTDVEVGPHNNLPSQESDVINLPRLGSVRGKLQYKTIANRPIHAFLGLKYGDISGGLARFQKASYPHATNRLFDATTEPAGCPSYPDLDKIVVTERSGLNVDDCLTLSVYTPSTTDSLAVMVYVHGEMLFDGNAEEAQPDYLLEKDVVLVSVNYRLAPFGFISTLTPELPGNVALADIQMALEWVRENIRAFGGNPDQVTLFGQSGGATLIHALGISGKAQGLFHKVILQSGTALNPYFIDEDPVSSARNLARQARCSFSESTTQAIVNCFARLKTSDMLNAFKSYWQENEPRGLRYCGGFKLVVGDQLGFLPKHPAALLNEFKYPLIAGIAKDAGAFIMSRFYNQLLQVRTKNISDYINIVLMHTSQPRHFLKWKNVALDHIFTPQDIRNPSLYGIAQGLLELTNLILYRAPLIESIRNTSKTNPTFLYSFDHRGQYHRFGHLENPLPFPVDATLSDENIYLFPYPVEVSSLSEMDKQVARQLTSMWTNFAQFNVPENNPQIWPRVSNEYGPYVRISQKIDLDYHFGEGVPMPVLYPEFAATTTTITSTTTTTTHRPQQIGEQYNWRTDYRRGSI